MLRITDGARSWRARAREGSLRVRTNADPVNFLLPGAAGARAGAPEMRGPLLRRLQVPIAGMLETVVEVSITHPGPLYVRLKPDPRGLVVLSKFDRVPDHPVTGCPSLGPVEAVGTVGPGDVLVSVNREVLLGRPFAECVECIRQASSDSEVYQTRLLCFRKADPAQNTAMGGSAPRR
ncbi:unnamed protein product, partial [Choristocarpus tenellus]